MLPLVTITMANWLLLLCLNRYYSAILGGGTKSAGEQSPLGGGGTKAAKG